MPPRPAGITPLSLSSWRAVMAWGYNISFGLVAFVLLVSLVLGACAAARSHLTPAYTTPLHPHLL